MNLETGSIANWGTAEGRDVNPGSDLGLYAAHIQELVLYLRDEGHVLSSMDQHVLEGWWQAGYPLEVVLHTVHDRGLRLKARKKPPRGLPLRSLSRYVEKAGEKALLQSVGGHGPATVSVATSGAAEREQLSLLLVGLEADLSDAVALREPSDPSQKILAELLAEFADLLSKRHGKAAVFSALLAMGRRYYDALWHWSPSGQQAELRAAVLASIGEGAVNMSGDALEETLAELCRRQLRGRDPLLDPERYWRGL